MNEASEYCPVKSAVTKALHSAYTWVLASFILGVLLMAAVGKDSDIQKAMWFATGAAITAVATGYQTYQSNKRAADEREFAAKQAQLEREHKINKTTVEHTLHVRISAYELFIDACTNAIEAGFNEKSRRDLISAATSKVGIAGTDSIFNECIAISGIANDLTLKLSQEKTEHLQKEIDELRKQFAMKFGEISVKMRRDIGRHDICIHSVPLRST